MIKPALFIVAGPNGAGKSLFSKELTVTDFEVFDGDKHMTALMKKFPETGSEALLSYINETIFTQEKQKALTSRRNYAFETNFSASDPMQTARELNVPDMIFICYSWDLIHYIENGKIFLKTKDYPAWVKPVIDQF